MTPVLEVSDLGVAFGGIRAVDGVSFAAERNAITTIIGPNGAGKSTLFNLISGLIRPHSGRVVLGGVDRTGVPPHLMQRAGLGRSFQITNLFFELSVFENLRLAAQRLDQFHFHVRRRFTWRPTVCQCARCDSGRRVQSALAGNSNHVQSRPDAFSTHFGRSDCGCGGGRNHFSDGNWRALPLLSRRSQEMRFV